MPPRPEIPPAGPHDEPWASGQRKRYLASLQTQDPVIPSPDHEGSTSATV
jgi:hypothetical protein